MALPVTSPAARTPGMTSLPNRASVGYATKPTPSLGGAAGAVGPTTAQRLGALSPQQRAAFNAWIQAQSRPATGVPTGTAAVPAVGTAPTQPGVAPTALPGTQEAAYGAQRDAANEQYNAGLSANRTSYAQTMENYLPQFRDLATTQQQQRTAEPDAYIARGILGSGINLDNLQQLNTQQFRQLSDLHGQEAGALGTLMNARNGIEAQRATALANIEQSRSRALAQLAIGSIK